MKTKRNVVYSYLGKYMVTTTFLICLLSFSNLNKWMAYTMGISVDSHFTYM